MQTERAHLDVVVETVRPENLAQLALHLAPRDVHLPEALACVEETLDAHHVRVALGEDVGDPDAVDAHTHRLVEVRERDIDLLGPRTLRGREQRNDGDRDQHRAGAVHRGPPWQSRILGWFVLAGEVPRRDGRGAQRLSPIMRPLLIVSAPAAGIGRALYIGLEESP